LFKSVIRILDELGRSGDEIGTRGEDAGSKLLSKKATAAKSGTIGTYSARNRTGTCTILRSLAPESNDGVKAAI
jgi:hypothetical protein